MKRALLVLGPESSGTHLLTRILLDAGCAGSDQEVQPWDRQEPAAPLIVWRRSIPHGGQWPPLGSMVASLTRGGYAVEAIVLSRDWGPMAQSQVAHGHVKTLDDAYDHIEEAYRRIFESITLRRLPYEIVNYEAVAQRPAATVAGLLARLGLAGNLAAYVYDGNAKYYETTTVKAIT